MNFELDRRHRLDIQKFDLSSTVSQLSRKEIKLLSTLEGAAEAGAKVYSLQFDDRFPGANFYPHDVTREEVFDAAIKRPDVLSPYTVVKRYGKGELIAVPYHIEYNSQLRSVTAQLREAVGYAELEQSSYLISVAQALGLGYHEKAVAEWLNMPKEPKIDILLGFYDRYTDKLLNKKFAFEAWVGVLNTEATEWSQGLVEQLIGRYVKSDFAGDGFVPPKIRVRIDHTTIFSGQAALFDWVANNMPCQSEWREKYGNKFTVFQPNLVDKVIYKVVPSLKLIKPSLQAEYAANKVFDIALLEYFGHEICHPLIRRGGDEDRLGGAYVAFSELFCTSLGLQLVNELDNLTDTDRDFLVAAHFSSTLREAEESLKSKRVAYEVGHRVLFNFFLDKGAIRVEGGRIKWRRGEDVLKHLPELNNRLVHIAQNGNETDFSNLVQEYGAKDRIFRLSYLKKAS